MQYTYRPTYALALATIFISSMAIVNAPHEQFNRETHDGGPVTEQMEAVIREIMEKYGYPDTVSKIRRFNQATIKEYEEGALICKFNSTDPSLPQLEYILYINEDWFESLPQDAQEFVICHELMHIRLCHFYVDLDPTSQKSVATMREQEKEADIAAAKLLGCVGGGIEFCFHLIDENKRDYYREHTDKLPMAPPPTGTHPTIGQRIAYLKELEKSL